MKNKEQVVHFYSDTEEKLNIATHAFGFVASIFGAYLLLQKGDVKIPKNLISYIVYSVSLLSLYAASTLYHSAKTIDLRRKLNIVDHAAIFILIAGSYTPFTLIALAGTLGWAVFIIVWFIAIVGVIIKLFFTGRYEKLSTAMYVAMGWLAIFVVGPLLSALPAPGFILLALGGLLYTIGAIFFSIKRIKFNHAIFHVFVLGGSLCHFLSIYLYV